MALRSVKVSASQLCIGVTASAAFFACECSPTYREGHPLAFQRRLLDGKPYTVSGRDAVLMCVMVNDAEHLRRLIAEGWDIKAPLSGLPEKPTFLHLAVQRGYIEIARVLLESGASPNARSSRDVTPLSMARESHQAKMIKLLSAYDAE